MSAWLLWPRDPLVVRDGRPNQGRSESATLAFPWPGTVAGVLRTRAGSDPDGRFVATDLARLRAIGLRGPLLTDGEAVYVPAPRDALAIRDVKDRLFALRPITATEGALFDADAPDTLVGFEAAQVPDGKAEALPAWWSWEVFASWLTAPEGVSRDALARGSLGGLPRERRVHVKLTADGVAEASMLFETEGLRFTRADDDHPMHGATPLGLFVTIDGEASLRGGLGAFAGERRLVRWEGSSKTLPPMPDALRAHLTADTKSVRVRVVLLTPGCFDAGSQPSLAGDGPLRSRDDVRVTRVASTVSRPETVSGWDLAAKAPKGTRRLVAAGSVFWITLEGSAGARLRWAEGVWMHNISDARQDRLDGYGLAALGVA